MSLDARERAIDSFSHDPDVRVFLMSLKAGGVALNLTAASHVMLMDPWCAPFETQKDVYIFVLASCTWKALKAGDRNTNKFAVPAGGTLWLKP